MPKIPGTFSSPPPVTDPDMHHDTCETHVPWCLPGSVTSGFLWSRWRAKHSRHSRRMRNTQFYASGKRPITCFLRLYVSSSTMYVLGRRTYWTPNISAQKNVVHHLLISPSPVWKSSASSGWASDSFNTRQMWFFVYRLFHNFLFHFLFLHF